MININGREIGEGHPSYIIAELSANHNQNFKVAVDTIHAIKNAGADAVKLQTYTADSMTLNSDQPWFKTRKDSLWAGQKLYDLYKKAYTPWEWHPKLKKIANDLGLDFFSSPFDKAAVDLLEEMDVPAYKIASLEITDIPLIQYSASMQKPMILSTGIASQEDIELAIQTCKGVGNDQIALLRCTSAYPTPFNEVNLRTIPVLKEKFKVLIGLSDHTLGITVPVAATVLGARIIEKHFILDRKLGGVDAEFSLNKEEFKEMVQAVREVEKALGSGSLEPTAKMKNAKGSARSLFFVRDIKKGETITEKNVRVIRPGNGLHPRYYEVLIGKKAKQDIERGTPVNFELLDEE